MKKIVSLVLTLSLTLNFCAGVHAGDFNSVNNGDIITGAVASSKLYIGTGNTLVEENAANTNDNSISGYGELILLPDNNKKSISEDTSLSLSSYEYTIGSETNNIADKIAPDSPMYIYLTLGVNARVQSQTSTSGAKSNYIYKNGKGEVASAILKNGFEMTYKINTGNSIVDVYVDDVSYGTVKSNRYVEKTITFNKPGMHKIVWQNNSAITSKVNIYNMEAKDMCDTNKDRVVNLTDAIVILKYKEGLTTAPKEQFDMDGNGIVDSADAAYTLKYLAKMY